MSVVAYKDGILAADTGATMGGIFQPPMSKIFQLKKCIVGCVGSRGEMDKFHFWRAMYCEDFPDTESVREKRPEFSDNSGFAAIELRPMEGGPIVGLWDSDLSIQATRSGGFFGDVDFLAIGSGADLALGAMATGATAEDAVRIACRFDSYCNEPVEVV